MEDERPSIARTVEVTRRLYRSGESEYLIDGEICRLRDVHELLMDTGLGAKAYAIIEQGKIGMILSSRPTDRRQLIEEAAGITKYKARRRAAELKLEAAQQNLTRLEDIIFELEKQFGSLKRQSAKARRYRRLRDELRHWEKLLFAGRYQESAQKIESLRARLADAHLREAAAASAVAEAETDFSRIRIALVDAEARPRAHARRCTPASWISTGGSSRLSSTASRSPLWRRVPKKCGQSLRRSRARREPGRLLLDRAPRSRGTSPAGSAARGRRAGADRVRVRRRKPAHRRSRGRRRSRALGGVFGAECGHHPASRHSACRRGDAARLGGAGKARSRGIRGPDRERAAGRRSSGHRRRIAPRERGGRSIDARENRSETELATARIELEWKSHNLQARERELAGLTARLASLTDLEKARAGYTDAARIVLQQANGHVGQQGSVADYLEVEPKYERAVEACLGDLLQHVIVATHEQAQAGLDLIRQENVGRCGFVVLDGAAVASGVVRPALAGPMRHRPGSVGLTPLHSVLRVAGPHATAIGAAMPDGFIADDLAAALSAAESTSACIATLAGDVVRGRLLVSGGSKDEGRAILGIKREIKELRDRIAGEEAERDQSVTEVAALETRIVQVSNALSAVNADLHREEKAIIALELQLQRSADDLQKVQKKMELLDIERRGAEEQRQGLEARQREAHESIARLERGTARCRRKAVSGAASPGDARESLQALARRAAEAKASYATLVERTGALDADVVRIEESNRDLEARIGASQAARSRHRRASARV